MLYSTRHKFIFFHVPKVAGSSIRIGLRKYSDFPFERLYNYLIDYIGQQPRINLYNRHISPLELQTASKNKENFSQFFKFAFVRNTWDWHVSQYHFHKQNEKFGVHHHIFKNMTFEEYVDWTIQEKNIVLTKSSQKSFLSDLDGNLLVDFVGRFETLEQDFSTVCQRIKLSSKVKVENKSKRGSNYQKYYSSETRMKIEKAYIEDIEFFNFKF